MSEPSLQALADRMEDLVRRLDVLGGDIERLNELFGGLDARAARVERGDFGGDLAPAGAVHTTRIVADATLDVAAGVLNFHASDLILDGRSGTSRLFRALVDQNDKLIINFNGDYRQGVEVHSDMVVGGDVAVGGLRVSGNLLINGPELSLRGRSGGLNPGGSFRALADAGNKLIINAENDYTSGVEVHGDLSVPNGVVLGSTRLEGRESQLWVHASMLVLNTAELHLQGKSGALDELKSFRALVDEGNKLIINFGSDYREGVEVQSRLHVTGRLTSPQGDCAELFEVAEEASAIPGAVMVLGHGGRLEPCREAGQRGVVGVVSGARDRGPALLLNVREGPWAPIALMGTAYVLCDAGFGAVAAGDLLTTSPTAGHAMGVPALEGFAGAIVGKALEPLASGRDLILMLVSLQ